MSEDTSGISLRACEEDIDILSELLDTNSTESEDYDIQEIIDGGDIDELTSYLNSSPGRQSDVGIIPATKMQPRVSQSDPLLTQQATSGCRDSLHARGTEKTQIQIPVVTSGGFGAPKSILMVVPNANSQSPCMTRNAVAARENRLKKKGYVTTLESDCHALREENASLKTQLSTHEQNIEKLGEQVAYLRSVIANQSTLSALLKNIQNVNGIKLASSWSRLSKSDEGVSKPCSQKKRIENQENEKAFLRRSKRKCVFESDNADKRMCGMSDTEDSNDVDEKSRPIGNVLPLRDPIKLDSVSNHKEAGICLHVNGSQVSLEFCATCSDMANSSRVLDDHSYFRAITDS